MERRIKDVEEKEIKKTRIKEVKTKHAGGGKAHASCYEDGEPGRGQTSRKTRSR